MPANSKTVRRSRQLPRSAPAIAACTRLSSFASSELGRFLALTHGLRRGLHSFAAPRLILRARFPCIRFAVWLAVGPGVRAGWRRWFRPRGQECPRYTRFGALCLLRERGPPRHTG